jgi:hypothetical protein
MLLDLDRMIPGDFSPILIGGWNIRSPTKIDMFYGGMALLLVLGIVILQLGVHPS